MLRSIIFEYLLTISIAYETNEYLDHRIGSKMSLKVYLLNGEVIQTIHVEPFHEVYRPYFSQSGEYFVVPVTVSLFILSLNIYSYLRPFSHTIS